MRNKKAVSPAIAVMLLVAVAVAATGAYFIWYKSFEQPTQKQVEIETSTLNIDEHEDLLDRVAYLENRMQINSVFIALACILAFFLIWERISKKEK